MEHPKEKAELPGEKEATLREKAPTLEAAYDAATKEITTHAPPLMTQPDRDLLRTLRKQAENDPTLPQCAAIQKQFRREYRDILHGSLNAIAEQCNTCSRKHGFQSDWLNVPEKLMLIVTELAEAMESYRHIDPQFLMTLKYPEVPKELTSPEQLKDSLNKMDNFQEELADALIRLVDLMSALHIDIEDVMAKKMAINELREYRHGKHR